MVMLPWIDFTAHNKQTGENLRAFSVNHPQAGRLVVIKGVSAAYDSAMSDLLFSRSKDGAWVIRASQLNVARLQSQAFPALSITNVNLNDIDLTDQFLNPAQQPVQPEKPKSHSGLNWLSYLTKQQSSDDQYKSYQGPIPSSIATTLWQYLDTNAESERLANGQIHYRGEFNDSAYLLVRRQRLLGGPENVIFLQASDSDLLPNLAQSSQAPTLFRLSDAVADQLVEIGHFYTHSANASISNSFTPSRNLANIRAQRAVNESNALDGEFLKATLPVNRPLVIASNEYSPVVTVADLVEALGVVPTESALSFLNDDDWETPPSNPENLTADGSIFAHALTRHTSLNHIAAERGFDSVVFYRQEAVGSTIGRDSYISDEGVSLNVMLLSPEVAEIVQREPRINQNHVPNGFEVKYLTRDNVDLISLVHLETGSAITKAGNPWFNSLAQAVAEVSHPDNAHFVNPTPEEISTALDDVFTKPVEVIAYRGEHGKKPDDAVFHSRGASISFSNIDVATAYATSPNDINDVPVEPRVIEARLTMAKPLVNTPDDPFIDFTVIEQAVGLDRTRAIASELEGSLAQTEAFNVYLKKNGLSAYTSVEELLAIKPDCLSSLYVDAYQVFDNPEWVQWFREAGFDGAVHAGNGTSELEAEYKIFSPAQAEILTVTALEPEVAAQPAENTDPALNPDNVAAMAAGAIQRNNREVEQRREWHENAEERLSTINSRQSTWIEFEGVKGLRINDEPYIAVPTTDRINAKYFHIIDVRSRDEIVTTLKRDEVQSWLYRATDVNELIQAAPVSTNTPISRGEALYAQLHESLEVVKDVDGLIYQSSVQTADSEEDAQAIEEFLVAQGFTHTSTRRTDEYTEQLPTGSQRIAISKNLDSQSITLSTIENHSFDVASIVTRMDEAIDTVVDKTAAILLHNVGTRERLAALDEHRDSIAHALRAINELSTRVSDAGESFADIIERALPDVTALGDPALSEVYNRMIDDNVPLAIESIESMMLRAIQTDAVPETPLLQESQVQDDLSILREKCLDALTVSKFFKEAGITISYENSQWFASFEGVEVARGHGPVDRSKVYDSLLRDLKLTSIITPATYAKLKSGEHQIERLQDTLDPLFHERWYSVRNQLVSEYKFETNNTSNFISESGAVSVRTNFTHAGAGYNVVGMSFSVGDKNLTDDLTQSPEQIAETIATWANELELTQEAHEGSVANERKEVGIETLESVDALREALERGDKVTADDVSYEIVNSTFGWKVVEGHDGYSTTLGGDIRGGGYTRADAVERALKSFVNYPWPAADIEDLTSTVDIPADTNAPAPEFAPPVDMFGGANPKEPNAKGSPITLQKGTSPTNIIVSGVGVMVVDRELEALGGRFIKKYAGYRFKKDDEPKVRDLIDGYVKKDQLALIDKIRVPFALRLGKTLVKGNTPFTITSITKHESGDDFKLILEGGNPEIFLYKSNTTAKDLEQTMDISISNWEELEALYGAAPESVKETTLEAEPIVSEVETEQEEPSTEVSLSEGVDADETVNVTELRPRPSLSVVNTAQVSVVEDETNEDQPEKFVSFRGVAYEHIGKNTQGNSIYVSNDGLRALLDDQGTLNTEKPFVTEAGKFIPPLTRENIFKTISEVTAETAVAGNVVSIRQTSNEEETLAAINNENFSEEEYNATLKERGLDPELLNEYFRAYGLWRNESENSKDGSQSFKLRRMESEVNKKESLIAVSIRNAGYSLDLSYLRKDAERIYQNAANKLDKLVAGLTATVINQRIDDEQLTLDFARTIARENAQSLPPSWLYKNLKIAKNRGVMTDAFNIMVAKAYGSPVDIERALNVADLNDRELTKQLTQEFDEKFKTIRANVELPAYIQELNEFIESYSGASPIPRANRESEVSALYKELAAIQYDIDALPIDDEDIEIYRLTGDYTEIAEKLAERHGISYDAGSLFVDRVQAELGRRAQAEFATLPETRLCLDTAKLVQETLPEGVEVIVTDKIDSPALTFLYGAGKIIIGRPEFQEETGFYRINYRHDSFERFSSNVNTSGHIDYPQLPTSAQLAKDVLSFAQRHHATAKIYFSPEFGAKIPLLGENKYNNTLIAKLIRDDIKEAIQIGALPKGIKVGLKKSGGNAIVLTVKELPDDFPVINPAFAAYRARQSFSFADRDCPPKYTHEANALSATLNRLMNAYNFDNSDIYSDYSHVNYYDSLYFDEDLSNPELRPIPEYEPIKEAEEQLYKYLNRDSFVAFNDFERLGFSYIGGRRVGLAFTGDSTLLLDETREHAPNAIVNHNGITDVKTEFATEIQRLGFSAVKTAFHLENRDFFADNLAERFAPVDESDALNSSIKDLVNKLSIQDQIHSGESVSIGLVSSDYDQPEFNVSLDGGILAVASDTGVVVSFDTTLDEWAPVVETDSALKVLQALNENTYGVGSLDLREREQVQDIPPIEASLHTYREESSVSKLEVLTTRLEIFESNDVVPTPISTPINGSKHFIGSKVGENNTFEGYLSTSMVSGDHNGFLAIASGHPTRTAAITAVAVALEEYAKEAYRQNQTQSMVEALIILSHIERSLNVGDFKSNLINDAERKIAAAGGEAIAQYYEGMRQHSNQDYPANITEVRAVTIPAIDGFSNAGTFELGSINNGEFTFGAKIPLLNGQSISVDMNETYGSYDGEEEAASAFVNTLKALSPQHAASIDQVIRNTFINEIPAPSSDQGLISAEVDNGNLFKITSQLHHEIKALEASLSNAGSEEDKADIEANLSLAKRRHDDVMVIRLQKVINSGEPAQVDQLDREYVNGLASRYPALRHTWNQYLLNQAELYTPANQTILDKWLKHTGMDTTHTGNGRAFDHKEPVGIIGDLVVISKQSNQEADPVYHLDVSGYPDSTQEIIANHARLNGALIEGQNVLFSSIDDLDSFADSNDLTYTITDQIIGNAPIIRTETRNSNISQELAKDLQAAGYVQSHLHNVWVTNTLAQDSVQITFFRGIDGESLDARIQVGNGKDRSSRHLTGLAQVISQPELEQKINDCLQDSGFPPVLSPAAEPSINTITDEQICAILLGAGLNLENVNDSWHVSGETYQFRNTLAHLGGEYKNTDTKKPIWIFNEPPAKRLASAISGQINTLGTTQNRINGFILTQSYDANDNHFLVTLSQGDANKSIITGAFSSLMKAKTAILTAIIDEDKLNALWEKVYGKESQGNKNNPISSSVNGEEPHARTTERPAGSTQRPDSGHDAASDHERQSRLGEKSNTPILDNLASDGRGIDRGNRGTSHDSGNGEADNKISVAPRTNASGAENTGSGENTNGRTIGESNDRVLFDLRAARSAQVNGASSIGKSTLKALQILRTLRTEGRPANDEEKIHLSRMVGLGAGEFNTSRNSIFSNYESGTTNRYIFDELNKYSPADRESLKSTVLTAFYTPATITDYMWNGLVRMGVKPTLPSLDIVDPGVGTGHFIGSAPEFVRQGANIHGIECDKVTAEIASHLYPEAKIINQEFQKVLYPANSKDLFIGNPPYSDVRTFNPNTGKREVLHDLFLREAMNATRPGGIVSFVTSSGTMDKKSTELRNYIFSQADLISAVRLPNGAFKEEAGTDVMTDILYFRKRKAGEPKLSDNWTKVTDQRFEFKDEIIQLPVNQYFVDNPQNVLGELEAASGQFGPKISCRAGSTPLEDLLNEKLTELPEDIFSPEKFKNPNVRQVDDQKQNTQVEIGETLDSTMRVGSLFINDDNEIRIVRYDGGEAKYFSDIANIKASEAKIITDYIAIRDCLKTLVNNENKPINDFLDAQLNEQRTRLNTLYDQFTKDHGPIGRKQNIKVLRKDPDCLFVAQLEHYDRETDSAIKADILSRRVIQSEGVPIIASPIDAAHISMSRYGYIHPTFVAEQLGESWESIREGLGDAIFFDPEAGQYTVASVYLCGDVVHKREVAERALHDMPELERNIAALTEVTPAPISITELRMKIGATWIPEEVLTAFARKILNADTYAKREKCTVQFQKDLKTWNFKVTELVLREARTNNTIDFGTEYFPFHKLLKCCLEQTRPTVTEEIDGVRVTNTEKTQAARDKQQIIEDAFVTFVLENPDHAKTMEDQYNYQMNRIVPPQGDGKYLTFPGITTHLKGKPFAFGAHQLAVIERGLTSEYGLLIAHEAGGGKTISTSVIAIKNKQLGLAKKPLIAVPNHMLIQYTTDALDVYPNARILTVSKDDLTKEGRENFAHKCRLNDWDLVICTHEQFTKLKMPTWYIENSITNEITELEEMIISNQGDSATIKQLERQKKALKERLESAIADLEKNQDDIDFTELGIDWIGYDEGHYLKNRAFPTKNSNLAGVQTLTSQRARDAEMKFDWIRESRGDKRGVLLATGTPISNTIGELMVILRYLAPELLERAGIHNFDNFIAAFGETKIHVELTADGSGYQLKERLSNFHNIPELMRIFSVVADIKMGDALNLIRPKVNQITRLSEMSPEQRLFMDWLSVRARRIKQGLVMPHEDNMLKIYTDLQTMSVDPRLYHHKLQDVKGSKVNLEVDDIYRAWVEGKDKKSTQLIFVDRYRKTINVPNGVTKEGKEKFRKVEVFNINEDIRDKLVAKGIPKSEIAFIHDVSTDEEKEDLFSKIRKGSVRITLATTAKMGVGTNVQTKGKDLRHLSYPMRSIDLEQRNKRYERMGNENDEINIHYPTTKDSGDLATLQMIDRKDKMLKPIMSMDFDNMSRSFEEEYSLSYEDIMAITTDNTVIKQKLETDSKVDTLRRKLAAHQSECYRAKHNASVNQNTLIPNIKEYVAESIAIKESIDEELLVKPFNLELGGKEYTKALDAGAEIQRMAAQMILKHVDQRVIGRCLGKELKLKKNMLGNFEISIDIGKKSIYAPVTDSLSHFPGRIASIVRDRVNGIEEGQQRIVTLEKETEDFLTLAERPFPMLDELREAEKLQSELNVEMAKLEKENPSNDLEEAHPFEILIAKLDGVQLEHPHSAEGRSRILNEEEIQHALDREQDELIEVRNSNNLTLVH